MQSLAMWIRLTACLTIISCSIQPNIPTVVDDRVTSLVRSEAARIVAVSEESDIFWTYQLFLSDFPRTDILGMSVGNKRIYISYKLASLALTDSNHRWLLRQTIAHEIAHETAGHAKDEGMSWFNRGRLGIGASGRDVGLPGYVRLYNYSREKELEADLKGLDYWTKLDWNCRIWVRILENFEKQNYIGDAFHPTDRRLQQARSFCELQEDKNHTSQIRHAG